MANKSGNLIVNYLPQNMTDRELYSMFVTVGPVESCKVMKDFKTGYSYGFGFVNYSRAEDAEKAIETLNGQEIFNKRIKVSYARPSGDDIKDTNLYVTNLPRHYTESDLDTLFGPYGTIVQKNLLLDKLTKLPRGVAFVRYNKREEAQEAIRNLDQQIPEGGNERLSVRVAEEHGKQKAAYYAGWQAGLQQSRGHHQPLIINKDLPEVRKKNLLSSGRQIMDTYYSEHTILQKSATKHPQTSSRRAEKESLILGMPGERAGQRGRGGPRGGMQGGRGIGMRGGRIANNYNNNLVSYPITRTTNNGFGALRQEKFQQRFNPIAFGMSSNGYSAF